MTIRQVQAITYAPPSSAGTVRRDEDPAQQELNFLQMLIAQISNQTPDSTMDPTAIATQFSQMQAAIGLVKLNAANAVYQQTSVASALLDRPVRIQRPGVDIRDPEAIVEGSVSAVDFSGPSPLVKVGEAFYPLQSVVYVGS
ncbi:MAG: flagellar hook capping FlgD N-terminal domain-containing protein [bacterium]|nr:flagellar hook capping FlgD N-terminal domain-containing protein [bacterium]